MTRAYFWPAVNKGPACFWPGYFLTQPDETFLIQREKMKNSRSLGKIFQTQCWLSQPGSKIFDLDPSLPSTPSQISQFIIDLFYKKYFEMVYQGQSSLLLENAYFIIQDMKLFTFHRSSFWQHTWPKNSLFFLRTLWIRPKTKQPPLWLHFC